MLKLPFIEKSHIGVELTAQTLYWIELSKLSNRIEVVGYGEIPITDSLEESLLELKNKIKSDAFYIGCTEKQLLISQIETQAPFSEDPSDLQKWLVKYDHDLETSFENSVVRSQLVVLGEDEQRVISQVNDVEAIESLKSVFNEQDIPLLNLSNGLIESGYSQILNPEFVESYSGVIAHSSEKYYLLIFDRGRIFNTYELPESDDIESVLSAADSILKTEEISLELTDSAIPCYYPFKNQNVQPFHRSFYLLEPFFNKGKTELPVEYARAAGVALKMCYPSLDNIELLDNSDKETAWFNYDKTELIRTSVLLFAPLIVFFLIAFSIDKWTEPKLNEVSQVSALVSDKLDMVAEEREAISELKTHFESLSSEYSELYITAPLFEIISTSIPQNIWLEDLRIENDDQFILTQIEGTSTSSNLITQLIESLQDNSRVNAARIISSENQISEIINQEQITFTIQFTSTKE